MLQTFGSLSMKNLPSASIELSTKPAPLNIPAQQRRHLRLVVWCKCDKVTATTYELELGLL